MVAAIKRVLLIFDKYFGGSDRLDIGIGDYVFIQTIQKLPGIETSVVYLYPEDTHQPEALTERIHQAIVQFSPDLIVMTPHFVGRGIACVPERQTFRRLCQGIPSVFISYDTGNDAIIRVPNERQEPVSWINYWDGYADIMVHTDCYYPVQQTFMGDRTLSHHICAFTPFDPALGQRDETQPRDIDYAFMGSVYQYRQPFVQALQALPFQGFIGDGPMTGRQLLYDEYLNILKRSKIAINFSKSWRGDGEQIKVRIWEVLTCGSLLFEQDSQESRRVLEAHDCAVFFESPEDLATKMSHYLQHPELLAAKTLAARAFLQDYSYEKFWQQVFDSVQNLGQGLTPAIAHDAPTEKPFQAWITALTPSSGFWAEQSPASLQWLTRGVQMYKPTQVVDLGTGRGLSLRAWLAADPALRVVAIDRDLTPLQQGEAVVPFDRSRVTLRPQDALTVDFSRLWTAADRVLLYVDVSDRPGMPLMADVLQRALPALPAGSVLMVDDLWYCPGGLSSQTLGTFWQSRVGLDVNPLDCFDGYVMPYWQGGSVLGGAGVLPLMAWVNAHRLELHYAANLKGIAIALPTSIPTDYPTPEPIAQFPYNPVGNFNLRVEDQNHPALPQALNHCQIGSQLYAIAQYASARQQFQQAAALLPHIGGLHYAQALCWWQEGDRTAALQALQQELQSPPVHPDAPELVNILQAGLR